MNRINHIIDPGRLPFDPEQLEIPAEDKSADFPNQPQGLVNNDPRQNNPLVAGGGAGKGGSQKSAKLTVQPAQGINPIERQRIIEGMGLGQRVSRRCRLSWLTNSALVYRVQMRGDCGDSANEHSCAHHVTWSPINFGDLTPYLTYGLVGGETLIEDNQKVLRRCLLKGLGHEIELKF